MAFLSYKEIVELIDKVAESGIGAIEIESSGTRVRIEGGSARFETKGQSEASPGNETVPEKTPVEVTSETTAVPSAIEESGGDEEVDPSWHIITSPIVGTFYEAPNPEAEPFVKVGDRVTRGMVLCIVEAMKLMNEIESDVDGEIVRIFPKNAQPIEYGERLFAVKTR